jgi:hypothetical protein
MIARIMRALVADEFPAQSLAELKALGLEVDYDPHCSADQLSAGSRVGDASILIVRSTHAKLDHRGVEQARDVQNQNVRSSRTLLHVMTFRATVPWGFLYQPGSS